MIMNREGAPIGEAEQEIKRKDQKESNFLPEYEKSFVKGLKVEIIPHIWETVTNPDLKEKIETHNERVDKFIADSKESGKVNFNAHDALNDEKIALDKELSEAE